MNRERILATVARIPAGRVASYGLVALEAGLPGCARLVGNTLRDCGDAVPWQRVLNARGAISLRGTSAERQRELLEAEGVELDDGGRVVDLVRTTWRPRSRRKTT